MENCDHRYQFSNKNIQKTESNTWLGALIRRTLIADFPNKSVSSRLLRSIHSKKETPPRGGFPAIWVVMWNMQHFILAVLCASCCSHVTPCNTLQHTATHHISLQHTAKHTATLEYVDIAHTSPPVEITTKLQFCTATHCNTLLHTRQHT